MNTSSLSWRFGWWDTEGPAERECSWWSWGGSFAETSTRADHPSPHLLYTEVLTLPFPSLSLSDDPTGTDPDIDLQTSAYYVKKEKNNILPEERLSFSKRYYRKVSKWIVCAYYQSLETVQSRILGTELIIPSHKEAQLFVLLLPWLSSLELITLVY